jgi:7-carboxy-7-deazaguanine synthase
MKLAVSEVFYSIQGEGITTGYPAVFIRLGGCNLMCGGEGTQRDGRLHNGATWRCDSIEVWMKSQAREFQHIIYGDCIEAIKNNAHVIITGGEPLMQQKNLVEFIKWIKDNINPNTYFEIETNGTIEPNAEMQSLINQWNCSPKLSNSGMSLQQTYIKNAIDTLNKLNTIFKFVISNINDYEEIKNTYKGIDKNKIWLMPAGSNQSEIKKSKKVVADICKKEYLKFTNRLHIEIWNKKTGV